MNIRTAIFLGLLATILPVITFAQIVPCTGPDCDWGKLLTLGQNILNFIVTLSVVAAGVVFAVAGIFYFSAGGDASKIQRAHSLFSAVVIGLVIVLTAWLVVNTILDTLTGRGLDQRAAEVR